MFCLIVKLESLYSNLLPPFSPVFLGESSKSKWHKFLWFGPGILHKEKKNYEGNNKSKEGWRTHQQKRGNTKQEQAYQSCNNNNSWISALVNSCLRSKLIWNVSTSRNLYTGFKWFFWKPLIVFCFVFWAIFQPKKEFIQSLINLIICLIFTYHSEKMNAGIT